jgi:hypothetical protein
MGTMHPRKPFAPVVEGELERSEGHRVRKSLEEAARGGRRLVEKVESSFRERPIVIVAASVGMGFVGGAIFGSRAVRWGLLVAAGYGIRPHVGAGKTIDPMAIARSIAARFRAERAAAS